MSVQEKNKAKASTAKLRAMKKPTANEIRLLALIAYRHGEISEGRCVELAKVSRHKIRDEMHRRCGKFSPLDESERENEELRRRLEAALFVGSNI